MGLNISNFQNTHCTIMSDPFIFNPIQICHPTFMYDQQSNIINSLNLVILEDLLTKELDDTELLISDYDIY